MRLCANCGETFRDDARVCPMDGSSLIDWSALSQSDSERATDPGWRSGATPVEHRATERDYAAALQQPVVRTALGGGTPVLEPSALPAPPASPVATPGALVAAGAAPSFSPGASSGAWNAATEIAPEPDKGRMLANRYLLKQQLGVGGFGAVFEALDTRLQKRIAIKVLSPQVAMNPEALARFRLEAIAASQIGHEGIIDVTDFDCDADGTHFIAMEYLHGRDLSHVLEAEGHLPVARVLAIATQVARALSVAHDQHTVHRDLKPANIYLTSRATADDVVKIIDFGISKVMHQALGGEALTTTGQILGTPYYMAPEQASGQHAIDGRCDVYALGIILFEMLTGDRPFSGATYLEVITKHLTIAAPAPSTRVRGITQQLDDIVLRALAKDPADRFASMSELARALTSELVVHDPESPLIGRTRMPTVPPVYGGGERRNGTGERMARTTLGSASGQVTHDSVAGIAAPRRGRRTVVAVAGVAAVVGGALAFMAVRDRSEPRPVAARSVEASASSTPVARPDTTPPTTETAPPPPPAAMVEPANAPSVAVRTVVRIVAEPSASLIVDGKKLGMTPRDVEIPAGGTPPTIELVRSGYEGIKRTVTASDGPRLRLSLVRVARRKAVLRKTRRKVRKTTVDPKKPAAPKTAPPKRVIVRPAPDFDVKPIVVQPAPG